MSLFDRLIKEALSNQPTLATLRLVVEKELLHHDILRILNEENLLADLTFIGGTCLRACYSGIRLSEDLDFTGGKDFSREQLSTMGVILTKQLSEKYGLTVTVDEPIKDKSNVDTWKIKIVTRPKQANLPLQRINIDICAIPSYEKQPMLLINPYGVDMGTAGLIIQAQSQEEIFTDKLLAFALRPNRIKNRDLWDIAWLHQKNIKPRLSLIPMKLADRQLAPQQFLNTFNQRKTQLKTSHTLYDEFHKEMIRFLPVSETQRISVDKKLWDFLFYLLDDLENQIKQVT